MGRKTETLKVQIGKNGLTTSVIEQIKILFKDKEKLKIVILKSACRDKEEAKKICDTIVQNLGKNYTYRLIGYVANFHKWRKEMK